MTHPLDHLVLPTRDLETAHARLGALGFTVAPQGTHPFGTVNRCVYFADGTFIEPLAVGDAGAVGQAAASGNAFVGRDRAFRTRNGEEGFSAVVFGTDDADADHARYAAAGGSAGRRLDFSRPVVDASGRVRAALQAHPNGAVRIREVAGVADAPAGKLRFLAQAADAPATPMAENGLVLSNAVVSLYDPAGFERRFGIGAEPAQLRFSAIVFGVGNTGIVQALLADKGVSHHLRGDRVIVPPVAGQGAAFVFEENP